MKKTLKKLTLHRETLKMLDSSALAPVDGGATGIQQTCRFNSCYAACPPSYDTQCIQCVQ